MCHLHLIDYSIPESQTFMQQGLPSLLTIYPSLQLPPIVRVSYPSSHCCNAFRDVLQIHANLQICRAPSPAADWGRCNHRIHSIAG